MRDISVMQEKASVLIEALPFIKQFADKVLVIKVGGELVDDQAAAASLAQDIYLLRSVGVKVVVCHGGGPQISRAMKRFGKEPEFIDGHRATDKETLEITAQVLLGDINRKLVSLLNVHGKRAMGLSGVDGKLIVVSQKSEKLGFVGEIEEVNIEVITSLLEQGFIPVVASLGADEAGTTYNINADVAAGHIAKSLKAEKLVVLTNVEGLYESFGDKNSLLSEINTRELQGLIHHGGLSAGMLPKTEAILGALHGGVKRAHILDGRVTHSLLIEIFTEEGAGTMVTPA